MQTPVYAVTGFLDSGKTTFLNQILNQRGSRALHLVVIQFEQGEEDFAPPTSGCDALFFPVREAERDATQIAREIADKICAAATPYSEIWIEWNGMQLFSLLQEILLQPALKRLIRLEKVLNIADAANLERLLAATGGVVAEQISSSDLLLLRNTTDSSQARRLKRLLCGYNPGLRVCWSGSHRHLYSQIFQPKLHSFTRFALLFGGAAAVALALSPYLSGWGIPINAIVNAFLGMLLQALPFLIIGVLLSSAIQVFVSREALERRLPKSFVKGVLFMLLSGLVLPVCDCASVPVFRSMVKKGIPLPLAVVFFAAAPVINPVVLLSTYYAFGGDWKVVFSRAGIGVFVAIVLGLLLHFRPPKQSVLSGVGVGGVTCVCGCEGDSLSVVGFRAKFLLFLRHSQAEFFSVSQYLVLGALIASVIQAVFPALLSAMPGGGGLALSILVMMAIAFLLSLCSSSDAVVARGLSGVFPAGALMAFLTFGPIFDIKNALMLSAGFQKRFILRLVVLTAAIVFCITFALYV